MDAWYVLVLFRLFLLLVSPPLFACDIQHLSTSLHTSLVHFISSVSRHDVDPGTDTLSP